MGTKWENTFDKKNDTKYKTTYYRQVKNIRSQRIHEIQIRGNMKLS